jgi:cardiolipin synthase
MHPARRARLPVLALLLAGLCGCTWFSPRPRNIFRTVFRVSPSASRPGAADFRAVMDKVTATAATSSNRVRLLTNGEEAFPAMLAAIEAARERISCEIYIIRLDAVGRRFRRALTAAARRGVTVRFLYDAIGSRGVEPQDFAELRAAGGEVRAFNPLHGWTVLRLNNRNHRKILVVDGRLAVMGGLNFAEEYDGDGVDGWRDTALLVEGPAALAAERIFARSWLQGGTGFLGRDLPVVGLSPVKRTLEAPFARLFGAEAPLRVAGRVPPERTGTARVRAVWSAPDRTASTILDMYVLAINSARRRVWITNGYFVPPILLSRALVGAARRGVDVRLLLQGPTDEPTVRAASLRHYGRLLEEGVRIWEWPHPILHAKTMVVDDVWATVGSANLDGRALYLNYEANFAVESAALAAALARQFSADLAAAREVTLADWARRPPGQRAKEVLLLLENQF